MPTSALKVKSLLHRSNAYGEYLFIYYTLRL